MAPELCRLSKASSWRGENSLNTRSRGGRTFGIRVGRRVLLSLLKDHFNSKSGTFSISSLRCFIWFCLTYDLFMFVMTTYVASPVIERNKICIIDARVNLEQIELKTLDDEDDWPRQGIAVEYVQENIVPCFRLKLGWGIDVTYFGGRATARNGDIIHHLMFVRLIVASFRKISALMLFRRCVSGPRTCRRLETRWYIREGENVDFYSISPHISVVGLFPSTPSRFIFQSHDGSSFSPYLTFSRNYIRQSG